MRALALAVSLLLAAPALAADQPVAGSRLRVKATAGGTRVTFVSRDPALIPPATGGANDPSRAGLVLEILTTGGPALTLTAEPHAVDPGWRVGDDRSDTFLFRTTMSGEGITVARLRGGSVLVRGRAAPGSLYGDLGTAIVRLWTGIERSCAVFDGASLRRAAPGWLFARDAPAPSVPDCSDASLLAWLGFDCGVSGWPACGGGCPAQGVCAPNFLGECVCAIPGAACGATAPVCNGLCPEGEACVVIEDGFPGAGGACACTPIGVTHCGQTGPPACGGFCPPGEVCAPVQAPSGQTCACTDSVCGPGFGACPPGSVCTLIPGGDYFCVPIPCGSDYPTCSGACAGGLDCLPVETGGGLCLCGVAGG